MVTEQEFIKSIKRRLDRWDMMPDIRESLIYEMLGKSDESLYLQKIFWFRIGGMDLLNSMLEWMIDHETNIALEIYGPQRHGKSTVGRSIAEKIKKMYERHSKTINIIWEFSNSDMTKRIKEDSLQSTEKFPTLQGPQLAKAVVEDLRGNCYVLDERPKQHGTGSVIEKDNLGNLIDMIAMGGINFILISPRRHDEFETYLKLRVLGYQNDKNIAVYYNRYGLPLGVCIIPRAVDIQIEEAYIERKYEGIFNIMTSGGLSHVEQEEITEKQIRISGLSDDFRELLREIFIRETGFEPLAWYYVPPEHEGKWSYQDVCDELQTDLKSDSMGRKIRYQKKKLSNTAKGNILEIFLYNYLSDNLPPDLYEIVRNSKNPDYLQETDKGFDVEIYKKNTNLSPFIPLSLCAVNCKLLLEDRTGRQLHCSPEYKHDNGFIFTVILPKCSFHVYNSGGSEWVNTGSVSDIGLEGLLNFITSQ